MSADAKGGQEATHPLLGDELRALRASTAAATFSVTMRFASASIRAPPERSAITLCASMPSARGKRFANSSGRPWTTLDGSSQFFRNARCYYILDGLDGYKPRGCGEDEPFSCDCCNHDPPN
jgi:hypothetical protein